MSERLRVEVVVVDYMRWISLCESVRSTPITSTSTAIPLSTLFHSVRFNSLHYVGLTLLHRCSFCSNAPFYPHLYGCTGCAPFCSNRRLVMYEMPGSGPSPHR